MAEAQVMDRPRRWDLPFSRDVAGDETHRDMTDESVDRLLGVEPFRSMDPKKFPSTLPLDGILRNDTRVCNFRNGDVVVRQGDYGNSAFLILSGRVRVILEGLDPVAIGRGERRRKSWWRSLIQLWTNPGAPEARDAAAYRQSRGQKPASPRGEAVLVQDVTNVLRVSPDAFETTINNIMEQGELFGESAALGRIPRAATVVADGDAELLELRWQGLRDLRKYDEALRSHVDEQYRRIGLSATLRASPLLAELNEAQLEQIGASAQFETHGQFDWYGTYRQLREKDQADALSAEPIVAQEGHYPNGLILIRAGFARLSRKHGNGERTFSYLGKGSTYGLAELAHNARHDESTALTATLRAVGYLDVVRIPTIAFEEIILPTVAAEMIPPLPAPLDATAGPQQIDPDIMEFMVENRYINGTATMLINLDRCTRCDECVRACAVGHENNPRFIRHGKITGHHMIANACMHCVDPVCMIGCPTGAIHRHEEAGEVVINDLTCIGCGSCAESCPYDNIRMVEVRDREDDAVMIDPKRGLPIIKATKCDLCVDHHGGPACERACPHDALIRADMRDLDSLGRWLQR